jgi:hypothetical protein
MLRGKTLKRLVVVSSVISVWFLTCPSALAEGEAASVIKVEEDWQLVLNVPDNNVNCPQFHTVISPGPDLTGLYFQIDWNYREQPDFSSGGLELLTWSGDSLVRHRSLRTEELSTTAETITWTQVLIANADQVLFQIKNGQSTTWGSFSTLNIGQTPGLDDLNAYSPDVSVANSWITYGSNRVELLALVSVRYYAYIDGSYVLVKTDETPHVVYQSVSESN